MNNNIKNKVMLDIEQIYKHGDCKYAIWNYVPNKFWVKSFNDWFPEKYSYNETDFNYSVCFTMYLNLSPINASFYSNEFDAYLKEKGYADLLLTHISVIAPYSIINYLQYRLVDGEVKVFSSCLPFKPKHAKYGDKLKKHLQAKNITFLDDEILLIKTKGISLELRKEDVRVYNCLFEDSDGWPK
ncbi:hypothetical protein ACFLYH_00350 [Candidatus Dependentiae bacterium]